MTIQEQNLENKLRLVNGPKGQKAKYVLPRVSNIGNCVLFLEDAKELSCRLRTDSLVGMEYVSKW